MPKDKTIPEGRRPEEFLNDARLAEYHAAQLADSPDDPALRRASRAAQMAALLTEGASVDIPAKK